MQRVAARNHHLAIAYVAHHRETTAHARLMQALVVQPAHFAIERFQRLEIGGKQPLAIEELDSFEKLGSSDDGHTYILVSALENFLLVTRMKVCLASCPVLRRQRRFHWHLAPQPRDVEPLLLGEIAEVVRSLYHGQLRAT